MTDRIPYVTVVCMLRMGQITPWYLMDWTVDLHNFASCDRLYASPTRSHSQLPCGFNHFSCRVDSIKLSDIWNSRPSRYAICGSMLQPNPRIFGMQQNCKLRGLEGHNHGLRQIYDTYSPKPTRSPIVLILMDCFHCISTYSSLNTASWTLITVISDDQWSTAFSPAVLKSH